MSTRDAGEQRSLLRVISTILQLTREEVAAVEARIIELEKTMVTMADRGRRGRGSSTVFADFTRGRRTFDAGHHRCFLVLKNKIDCKQ